MTTGDELWDRLDAAARRFVDVCASVPPDGRAWRSEWTAHDVARHVLSVVERYPRRDLRDPSGLGATASDIPLMNDEALAAADPLPMDEVLARIDAEMGNVRSAMPPTMDLAERIPFHGGATLDGAGALANLIGELTMHGCDVALGAGQRFPVARRDAVLILNALVQMAPAFVKPDSGSLTVLLRVRGSVPWLLAIADGRAVSRPREQGDHVDAVVRGPAPTLLSAFYKRHSIGESIRRGMIVSGGRRPWRALSLPSMIESV